MKLCCEISSKIRPWELQLLELLQNNYSGTGGYGQQPAVDPSVAQWFSAVDTDRSGQISAQELQRALVNGNWSHFSEEACRMMIGEYFTIAQGHENTKRLKLHIISY